MRFSYRSLPALRYLESGHIRKNILFFEEDITDPVLHHALLNTGDFFNTFEKHIPLFKSNILVLSSAFESAAREAARKLLDAYLDAPMSPEDAEPMYGTCVMSDGVIMFGFQKTSVGVISQETFWFNKSGSLAAAIYDEGNGRKLNWGTNSATPEHRKLLANQSILYPLVTILFKKYASIETKYIQANKKLKDTHCKYVNDTNVGITHLDSKWFTTIVKSDGFKVRGHFRFQPKKKDGEWTKELIWINEFQKDGYTAPARKLAHEF